MKEYSQGFVLFLLYFAISSQGENYEKRLDDYFLPFSPVMQMWYTVGMGRPAKETFF